MTPTAAHPPVARELTADDITWDSPAAPESAPAPADDFLVDALIDGQSYRVLAQQAIHHTHELHVALERLRGQHLRLVGDYRALRESTPRGPDA